MRRGEELRRKAPVLPCGRLKTGNTKPSVPKSNPSPFWKAETRRPRSNGLASTQSSSSIYRATRLRDKPALPTTVQRTSKPRAIHVDETTPARTVAPTASGFAWSPRPGRNRLPTPETPTDSGAAPLSRKRATKARRTSNRFSRCRAARRPRPYTRIWTPPVLQGVCLKGWPSDTGFVPRFAMSSSSLALAAIGQPSTRISGL